MVRYIYRIDGTDHITFVNSKWLEFARENCAPELANSSIVGASIWGFIKGAETRLLYESLFARLRDKNNEVTLPFHCDSPTAIRKMELTLRSMPRGGYRVRGSALGGQGESIHPHARSSSRSECEGSGDLQLLPTGRGIAGGVERTRNGRRSPASIRNRQRATPGRACLPPVQRSGSPARFRRFRGDRIASLTVLTHSGRMDPWLA